MMREKYESLPLATLKELAKARGLKGISVIKKAELIELMLKEDEKDKKGGVLAIFPPCGRGLLVVHVANSLEKQQRKYILLISSRVNICAEENGGVPQIGLQFLNGDPFTH